ncbi:xylulokinase [Corticicoccus populi]|uniref:Xylulose kinase n=1 Tax=Corticicoccus populi TaxID=1812821 RepID=A0ABW5WXA5_9STAP
MKYVIGIDLGTSAVKVLLVNLYGKVEQEISKEYPLIQKKSGYNEQNPELWVAQTISALRELISGFGGRPEDIEGISFSGQMHGLVLLDKNHEVICPAILWNDTRTTKECEEITEAIGYQKLLGITKNIALEGFTLPKILWVKNHEPENYKQISHFLLPKDYLRFRMTGALHSEFSDAAGTLLLDIENSSWSDEICRILDIDINMCPPLISSHECVGTITNEFADETGLNQSTKIFAGGADNACGAIGSGILEEGRTMVSIGTSGVVLAHEKNNDKSFDGKVHYFDHAVPDSYYTMGVTLSAGHSFSWFKNTFAETEEYEALIEEAENTPVGSDGLLFSPYLSGERTPHVDASIRGSFIGMDSRHERKHFTRAVLEGITFSLNESIEIFRENGKEVEKIISIGGGAKSEIWLQMQADIFNGEVTKLTSEQGPGMGAAMLAAYGTGWFNSLKECANIFLSEDKTFTPIRENVEKYQYLFEQYKLIYSSTKEINEKLVAFREQSL